MARRTAALVAGLAVCAAACTSSPRGESEVSVTASTLTTTSIPGRGGPTTGPPSIAAYPPTYDLERRTMPQIDGMAPFEFLARDGVGGQQAVKFSILGWNGSSPVVEWLDGQVFDLHDEWYYFQLLNGRTVDGFDVEPVAGLAFESVDEIYDWARQQGDELPLDLRFTGLGRLVSGDFYDAALDDPDARPVALGKVIRLPARDDRPERWLLELEFSDRGDAADVERFFDIVSPTLPPEVADALAWVPRSREQELVAAKMAAEGLPYGNRIVRYADIVEPGDTEVYASGVAAGRIMMITDDGRWALSDAEPTDVVVVQRTPDALPPASAFITAAPQTPLSHVNVLAINRGIPNAFLGGAVTNEELEQLGRARAPVAIRAIEPDQLDIRAMTSSEFRRWRDLQGRSPIAVPPVDLELLPLTFSIDDLSADGPLAAANIDEWRPIIGGKAAGFLGLAAPGTVTMPDQPMAISVRGYRQHVAPLDDVIEAMLASTEFDRSTRARLVLTEGIEALGEIDLSVAAAKWAEDFVAEHPPGTPLGDIVAAGGLKEMIRDLDVDAELLDEITDDLVANFDGYAPTQGLRFRSSSSVEDVEGFNGAGLYSSNTGYIDPTVLPDTDDHKRTVARALKRTWSSYWNIEAVEERNLENVDHLSGAMGVLVHARFDDPLELSNGVATFTILQTGLTVMRVNVQDGATSVTNPDNIAGQAPEVLSVWSRTEAGSDLDIDRGDVSSIVGPGEVVLDDTQVSWLNQQLRDVTVAWLDRTNASLPAAQQSSTLTLDFEFRQMTAGWPALDADRQPFAERIVVKQARTLEPGLRRLPAEFRSLQVPRDVLARTVRIERDGCPTVDDGSSRLKLFTDPLASVDMGYSVTPLVVELPVEDLDPDCTEGVVFTSPTDYLLSLFDD